MLRSHPPVINYWLCCFLFPKEAKEFSNKLSASAWDLLGFVWVQHGI